MNPLNDLQWSLHYGKIGHYVFKDGITLATWVLIVTGIATVLFAWRQITVQRRQSRLENLERIVEWFDDEQFRIKRSELAKARLNAKQVLKKIDLSDCNDGDEILDFFEHVAFLVKQKHLALYDVWHSFYEWVAIYYSDFRGVIEESQKDDPSTYDDLCWLDQKLREEEARQRNKKLRKWFLAVRSESIPEKTTDDIEAQYSYDIRMSGWAIPPRRRARRSAK